MNNLVRVISQNGGVFVCAVDATEAVREMERLHRTSATASAALGRALSGAALMGCLLKGEEDSVTLRFKGGGPAGTVTAICDARGNLRGSIDFPLADLPLNPANGKLNVGALVGAQGTLTVMRGSGKGEPYVGQVPLVSGEIAEDLTSYYALSEQTPTAVALGVLVNPDLTIRAAGGYLLQMLPGASEEEITLVEGNIAGLEAVTALLEKGKTPRDIAFAVLDGFSPELLDTSCVRYRCNCSRDKMERVLISLGRGELERLAAEQEETEIVCSYCNKKYVFRDDALLALAENL